eukprot:CAMPEP_0185576012 /NCGR_PEP_ID=MMETSP0434-20130131/7042_1 /TAXON_ID=626734 ORGANISM="Favella taraikaensis, Strain Fe Narragansett Bay" /NCGR_SAMPLE_ID=MMETSP0434 /ASSEMBLY_ACC=CAM_ASM_000379 /LENGTH=146 /DNA_ID=CAMNT_0028193059 /DNA_START=1220 /DNA_END=1659 /DNA_ORIENTATION=+
MLWPGTLFRSWCCKSSALAPKLTMLRLFITSALPNSPSHSEKLEHAAEADENKAQNRKELEVPLVLEYVRRIEEAKATHAANASISVMLKKINQEQVPVLQDLAKIRAFDKLFLDTGIEEEDITHAFMTHGISEREEFKKIIAEAK